MLLRCSSGFGGVALAALLREAAFGSAVGESPDASPSHGASRPPHHAVKARSVIFLDIDGGPSQVDSNT